MVKANLAKNTTYFTLALTVQKILAFVYFWFISNNLFPGQLGQYVFALSFTTLFSIFIDLGLSPILTREASKDQKEANRFLSNVLGIKTPLAFITLLAVWLTINISGKPEEIKMLVYIASFVMALDSFSLSFWVIFRARHNLRFESISTILVQIIIFSFGILALYTSGEVKHLIMALLAASIFNFLFALALLKFKLKFSLKPRLDRPTVKYFLKVMPAFALAGVFIKIYNTSDAVLLSYLAGDEAVGFFAVPAKVVFAFQQIIPAAFAAVIYPAFSYYYKNSQTKLENTFNKAFSYLTIISIPLTFGIITLAPDIIHLIWPNYASVIPTFFVMALAIPFIFLAFPTGHLLNACDKQKFTTFNRGIITLMAVLLNVALIPQLSYLGAGITFLTTNFFLLFMDFFWVKDVISLKVYRLLVIVFKSILASLVMTALILITKNTLNLLIIIPCSVFIYFTVLYLIKGFSLKEIKNLKASLR